MSHVGYMIFKWNKGSHRLIMMGDSKDALHVGLEWAIKGPVEFEEQSVQDSENIAPRYRGIF